MHVVILDPEEHFLAHRKRIGADRWDEMWEGVLHMPPAPYIEHQDVESDLETYLKKHWAEPIKASVRRQINLASIGSWQNDYRIPDIILLKRDRFDIIKEACYEGAPNVVVEIHSPGDESYEKLPFYFRLGVLETWIIDRDTKTPEIYIPGKARYRRQRPTAAGWVKSAETGVEMRVGAPGKLLIRMNGDDATLAELPGN